MTNQIEKSRIINVHYKKISELEFYLNETYGYAGHGGSRSTLIKRYNNGLILKFISENYDYNPLNLKFQLVINNPSAFHKTELNKLGKIANI